MEDGSMRLKNTFFGEGVNKTPTAKHTSPLTALKDVQGGGLLSITINTELRGKNRAMSPAFLSKRMGSWGPVAAVPPLRDPGPATAPPLLNSGPSHPPTLTFYLFCHTKLLVSALSCRKSGKFLTTLGLFNTTPQAPDSHTQLYKVQNSEGTGGQTD